LQRLADAEEPGLQGSVPAALDGRLTSAAESATLILRAT
jgi:hypothetical protein